MLTPSDIEQKTFHTSLRGYDLDEVDDFLDDVVATIRELTEKLEAAQGGSIEPSVGDESAVGRALVAAQTAADQMIADAKAEAEKIVSEARSEADTWISERDEKKAAADEEMQELTQHVASVRTQLAVLAAAVADRLDEMDEALGSDPSTEEDETDDGFETEETAGPGEDTEEERSSDEELDHAADSESIWEREDPNDAGESEENHLD